MGLFTRLKRLLETPSLTDDAEDAPYRCIQCGHPHGRQAANCQNCGGSFVAPVDGEEEREGDRDPRTRR
jgi:rubrerythrin